MGKSVEKTGKTVNDAITAALEELELTLDDVHVDVLNEGKTGLFGILSSKPARVRVSELEEDERVSVPGYIMKPKDGAGYAGATVAGGGALEDGDDESYEDGDGYGADGQYDGDEAGGTSAAGDKTAAAGGDGINDTVFSDGKTDGGTDSGYAETDYPFDFDYEINRATEYLYDIFNGVHVTVSMNTEATEEGFLINIESDDSGILIGHRGETLDAIQYLVNLYMNKGRNDFIRVTVDIENYKKKREAALIRLAGQMADKVVRLRRNFALDAMNSYERRIVHSALQNHPKVETYSVGEDPNRKVVVTLKNNRGGYSSR